MGVQAQCNTTEREATSSEINHLRSSYLKKKESAVYERKMGKCNISRNGIKKQDKWEYPKRRGVILVTADFYRGLIPSGHSAIVLSKSNVIESLSNGVVKGKNNWNEKKKDCSAVTPYKTTVNQDKKAADYAENQKGKPYNWNFFDVNTTKKYYCSQLVWQAFKKKGNVDLNTDFFGQVVYPLELANTDETYFIYVK